MSAPEQLRWVLAALMLLVAAYHGRRIAGGGHRVDIEVTHLAMSLCMASMLVAVLPRLSQHVAAGTFLAVLVWFLTDAIHRYIWVGAAAARPPALQVPICAAMAYMLLAPVVAPSAMPGMTRGSGADGLLAAVVAVGVAVPALAAVLDPIRRRTTSGALGIGCQLAMTGTAVVMLAAS